MTNYTKQGGKREPMFERCPSATCNIVCDGLERLDARQLFQERQCSSEKFCLFNLEFLADHIHQVLKFQWPRENVLRRVPKSLILETVQGHFHHGDGVRMLDNTFFPFWYLGFFSLFWHSNYGCLSKPCQDKFSSLQGQMNSLVISKHCVILEYQINAFQYDCS